MAASQEKAVITVRLPDGTVFECEAEAHDYVWKSKGGWGAGRATKPIYHPGGLDMPRQGFYLPSGSIVVGTDYVISLNIMQSRRVAPDYVSHFDAVEAAMSAETRPDVLQSLERERAIMLVPHSDQSDLFQFTSPTKVAEPPPLTATPAKSNADNPLNQAPSTVPVGTGGQKGR